MKNRNELILDCKELKILDVPNPKEVLLPLKDFNFRNDQHRIQEGISVSTGESIFPGVFSTVTGKISRIEKNIQLLGTLAQAKRENGEDFGDYFIRIEVSEIEQDDISIKADTQFMSKEPTELLEKLNRANLGFYENFSEINGVNHLIISAFDSDPLQWVSQQLLREESVQIIEGLKLFRFLTSAQRVILVVPEELAQKADEIRGSNSWLTIHSIKSVYPKGLPELIVWNLEKRYNLEKYLFINIEKVIASVNALKRGKSFVSKVVTVTDREGSANYRVRIGMPLKDLLAFRGCDLKDDDKVIINGPMRGFTCFNISSPILDNVDSVYIQPADSKDRVFFWNNQCMNCGRCVRVCPVNLDVNLICRYSEFSLFEECHRLGVMNCIECGLCSYHCPSGRSLLQFIQLGKKMENK